MKKSKKMVSIKDFEATKEARVSLLTRLVKLLDDDSQRLTSCEIRMYLLDAMDL